jgi:archaemetzincin
MVQPVRTLLFLFLALVLLSCSSADSGTASNTALKTQVEPPEKLISAMKAVAPFFKPMGKPAAYDWLGSHNEPGQTFEEYINQEPVLPTAERGKLYVLPLGSFSEAQKKIIAVTSGFLEAFYGLPVEQMPPRPFQAVSPNVRENRLTHTRQTKTG